MGEVKSLFGDVPEPKPEMPPREVSFRDVVEMKYSDICKGFHMLPPASTHVQAPLGVYSFLIVQLGHARAALKDVELMMTWLSEQREQLSPADFAGVVGAAIESTCEHIDKSLGLDETQIGLKPDTVPAGFEEEHVDMPLCPGCGQPPPPAIDEDLLPFAYRSMFASHPFTRKEIALCADRNRPRAS